MYSTNNKNLERQNKVEEQNIIIDPTKTCNVWIDDLFLPQGSEKECLKRWKNARKPWENQQPIGRKNAFRQNQGTGVVQAARKIFSSQILIKSSRASSLKMTRSILPTRSIMFLDPKSQNVSRIFPPLSS